MRTGWRKKRKEFQPSLRPPQKGKIILSVDKKLNAWVCAWTFNAFTHKTLSSSSSSKKGLCHLLFFFPSCFFTCWQCIKSFCLFVFNFGTVFWRNVATIPQNHDIWDLLRLFRKTWLSTLFFKLNFQYLKPIAGITATLILLIGR